VFKSVKVKNPARVGSVLNTPSIKCQLHVFVK